MLSQVENRRTNLPVYLSQTDRRTNLPVYLSQQAQRPSTPEEQRLLVAAQAITEAPSPLLVGGLVAGGVIAVGTVILLLVRPKKEE